MATPPKSSKTSKASKVCYRIVDWEALFENAMSRKLRRLTYVCVPNKHDGKSFRRLSRNGDCVAIYCAWQLILQLASKMPTRGVLADGDGPLDAEDMCDKTGFPTEIFEAALAELCSEKIGWLEVVGEDYPTTAELPGILGTPPGLESGPPAKSKEPGESPANSTEAGESPTIPDKPGESPGKQETPGGVGRETGLKGREGNGIEGKGIPPAVPQGGQERAEQVQPMPGSGQEAVQRICRIAGRKRLHLGYEAQHAITALLPIPEEEFAVVEWFYGLPKNEKIRELSNRRWDADTLAIHWAQEVDRANRYGVEIGKNKKNGAAKIEPEGWRDAAVRLYGTNVHLPGSFFELDDDVRGEIEAELQSGAAQQ